MKMVDMYWKKDKSWWHYEGHVPVMNEDAPAKAKESYENYWKSKEKK